MMDRELRTEANGALGAAAGVAALVLASEAASAHDWLRRIAHSIVVGLVIVNVAMRIAGRTFRD